MTALWFDHPATPSQTRLAFARNVSKRTRPTQANVLLDLLRLARSKGLPLELPEIMAAGIVQHGARLYEIRKRGHIVENVIQRAADGRILSRYYLRFDPEQDGGQK